MNARSDYAPVIHDFRRPRELDGEEIVHPVAIVGGGPVGMTLALEFARRGIASVIVEQANSVGLGSRAICISRRSLDILDGIGVAAAFRAKGLGWTHGTSFYRNRPVYRLSMPWVAGEKHHPMTNLQQYYIEEFLLAGVLAEPLIDLRWDSRFLSLRQDDDGVAMEVASPAGTYRLRSRYIAACDGARSGVRDALGLSLAGKSHTGRYLIADIRLRSSYPTERRAWFDPPSNPGATVLMHKQPDDIWRIDYQILDDQDAERELEPERIRARVQSHLTMIGEHGPWELVWHSLYRAHCLALDDYRSGRVFFAGDAAHLVPIFGVRGLNSGIADANNLGWKLAASLRGEAGATLLDSYNVERRAATMDILAQAEKSTIFMTPPSDGYRLLREAVLSLALTHEFVRCLIDPRQSVPYDYVDSPLTTPALPGDVPADPRPGAPLPNLPLPRGGHLLDHLGPGFNLLVFGDRAIAAKLGAQSTALRCLVIGPASECDIDDPDGALACALGGLPGGGILLRPDAHVAARLAGVDGQTVRAALCRALGRPASEAASHAA